MVDTPVFAQTIVVGDAICTAAKTTYTDATNAVLLLTAGSNGGKLIGLRALPNATVTATKLQLFSSLDGGTTLALIDSALMAAYTQATSTATPVVDFFYSEDNYRLLQPNERLYVGIGVALAGGIAFRGEAVMF